jgi:hypothetical protein
MNELVPMQEPPYLILNFQTAKESQHGSWSVLAHLGDFGPQIGNPPIASLGLLNSNKRVVGGHRYCFVTRPDCTFPGHGDCLRAFTSQCYPLSTKCSLFSSS